MKNRVVRRLAALLMSVAMLVSGLTFAEAVEVTSEPAAQAAEQTAVVSEDLAASETNTAVPEQGASDAFNETSGTSDVGADPDSAAPESAGEDGDATDAASAQSGEAGEDVDSSTEGTEAVATDGVTTEDAESEESDPETSDERKNTDSSLEISNIDLAADAGIMFASVSDECEHEWLDMDGRSVIGIAYAGLDGHKCTYQIVTYQVCWKCNKINPDTYDNSKTETDSTSTPHSWLNGKCMECGYECPHPSSVPWEIDTSLTSYAYWDKDTCQPTYLYYRNFSKNPCPVCGYKRELYDYRLGEPEPHVYGMDDSCKHCGYLPSSGGHEHAWEENTVEYGYESYTDGGAQCKGTNKTKTVTYVCTNKNDSMKCTATKTTTTIEETGEFSVDHVYSMGVCVNCGHLRGEACSHPNKHVLDTETSYTGKFTNPVRDNNNRTHTTVSLMTTTYYCPDCDLTYTVDEKVEKTDKCVFVENENKDGFTCSVCGHAVNCLHSRLTEGNVLEPVVTYKEAAGDDTNHIKIVSKGWKCPDCSEDVYPEDTTSLVEESEPHNYDAQGVCQTPGCQHACTHNGGAAKVNGDLTVDHYTSTDATHTPVQTSTWTCSICKLTGENSAAPGEAAAHSYVEQNGEYACSVCEHVCAHSSVKTTESAEKNSSWATSAEGHIRHWEVDVTTECDTCPYVKTVTEARAAALEPHTWDAVTGKCSVCGYECQHADCDTVESTKWNDFIADNDATHSRTGVKTTTATCKTCGYVTVKTEEVAETKVAHSYENGVCTACQRVCTHDGDHAKVYGETVPEGYAITDATHTPALVTPWECSICKLTGERAEPKSEPVAHSYVEKNGEYVCSACGHVCAHSGATTTESDEKNVTWETSAEGHIRHWEVDVTTDCDTCPYVKTVTEARADALTAHTWDPATGKCSVCGYACEHADCTVTEDTKWADYTVDDDATHSRTGVKTTTTTCKVCGNVTVKVEDVAETKVAHTYEDGVCTACGHACEHSGAKAQEPVIEITEKVELEGDDAAHKLVGTKTTKYVCEHCGKIDESKTLIETYEGAEAHSYKDGVCTVCGHACKHSGAKAQEPVIEITERIEVEDDDAAHKTVGTKTTKYVCEHCGEIDESRTNVEAYEGTETHSYKDGVCTVCGHECAHSGEGTAQTPVTDITGREEIPGNDTMHKTVGTTTTQYACAHCRQIVEDKTETEPYESTEAHIYNGGVCTVCGHVCWHSHTTEAQVTDQFVPNGVYTPNGTAGHLASGHMITVIECDDCGMTWNAQGAELVSVLQDHIYENGVCTVCGFVRPIVSKPTEQPVPADEPLFEEVAPNEVVHNVSASEDLRMATALGTAIEGIQAEYGANVSIVVNHAEEVLSAREYATMTKLPAVEQIMAFMSALGYGDEVQYGLSEMGIVLSDDAVELIEEIRQRLESMSGAELAQYQAALNEFFAEVGGTNAQHTQITLEIRVKLPGGYRTERYGFELKDGAWYFTKLSIAGA